MRRAERVVGALRALGEPAQPVLLAKRPDPVAAPCQDLVGIALVRNVPDDPVLGCVEHRMERHGEFDHAKPRAQMPACDADRADRLGPEFMGELRQLRVRQAVQVLGHLHPVEERGIGSVGQSGLRGERASGPAR